tara:strand:+ start:31 stop:591 length:561 start_codon:yes stop_codon:yes gene_type:complete
MITNLFPTALYTTRFEGNLKPYIQHCLELSETFKKGGNDWVHQPYNTHNKHNIFQDKRFKPLTTFFDEHAKIFAKNLNMNSFLKREAWFNLYKMGDSQEYHNHHWKSISGIFYLKSTLDDARTIFKSPIKDYPKDGDLEENNPYTWKTYSFKPGQGVLLLFKSDLEHCVEKQKKKSKRITIALNYD